MSLLTRLEKLEKKAENIDTGFDMESAFAHAHKALVELKLRPLTLQERIAETKRRIAETDLCALDGVDGVTRSLAEIRLEIDKRMLAMLEADFDLLEPLLVDPDGTEAHG